MTNFEKLELACFKRSGVSEYSPQLEAERQILDIEIENMSDVLSRDEIEKARKFFLDNSTFVGLGKLS